MKNRHVAPARCSNRNRVVTRASKSVTRMCKTLRLPRRSLAGHDKRHQAATRLSSALWGTLQLFAIAAIPRVLPTQDRPLLVREGCATCRIALELAATLSEGAKPASVGQNDVLARDSRGRIYLANYHYPGQVLVFDSLGQLLSRLNLDARQSAHATSRNRPTRVSQLLIAPGDTLVAFSASSSSVLAGC